MIEGRSGKLGLLRFPGVGGTYSERKDKLMTGTDLQRLMKEGGVNINTVIAAITLITIIAGGGSIYTSIKYQLEERQQWEEEHMKFHADRAQHYAGQFATIGTQISNHLANFQVMKSEVDNVMYRLGQQEKVSENNAERMGRMAESYANNNTATNGKLGALEIQMALALDALKRLERSIDRPGTGKDESMN